MYSFSFQVTELFCQNQFLAMEFQQTQRHASSAQVFIMKVLCTNPTLHMLSTLCSSAAAAFVLAASMLSSVAVHCLPSLCRRLSTSIVVSLQPSSSDDFQCRCSVPSQKSRSSLPLRWETCKDVNRNEAQGVATNSAGRWKVPS